jgi:polar amino acid transport system substrate-binding protein
MLCLSVAAASDFGAKRIAIVVGLTDDRYVHKIFPDAKILYVSSIPDLFASVRAKKADYLLSNGEFVGESAIKNSDFEVKRIFENEDDMMKRGFAFFKERNKLRGEFDEFLEEIRNSGELEKLIKGWRYDFENMPSPQIKNSKINGKFIFGTSLSELPASTTRNEKPAGIDIDIAYRFANKYNYDIEIRAFDFTALIPAVISGKADMIAANIIISEEGAEAFGFSQPHLKEPHYVAGLKEGHPFAGEKQNIIYWMKNGIKQNLIVEDRWKLLAEGLKITMIITVLTQIFSMFFGAAMCFLFLRKNRFALYSAKFYEWIIRGTPAVVLLMISYYVIFGTIDISPILIAVVAFTMIESVNIGRSLYDTITDVDKTEVEAARSIGFSQFQAFLFVIFPQAIKRILPSLMNGFVELMKATAIVGYIAIFDLSLAGDIIRSRTYDAYFPILFVALIYLTVTTVCIASFKFIVKKINKGA